MTGRTVPYPSPGEILTHEFLQPMGITAGDLAREMGVPLPVIEQILTGGDLPQDIALKLSQRFGMSAGFWTGLQADYRAKNRAL